jgi:hypothetical protein
MNTHHICISAFIQATQGKPRLNDGICRQPTGGFEMNGFVSVYLRARRCPVDRRDLKSMDDWMLADIGLTRSDIGAMIRGETSYALKSRR